MNQEAWSAVDGYIAEPRLLQDPIFAGSLAVSAAVRPLSATALRTTDAEGWDGFAIVIVA